MRIHFGSSAQLIWIPTEVE
ncbi:hypothetical protein JMJ77_0013051, partial [Colletotrichum scovillei]